MGSSRPAAAYIASDGCRTTRARFAANASTRARGSGCVSPASAATAAAMLLPRAYAARSGVFRNGDALRPLLP